MTSVTSIVLHEAMKTCLPSASLQMYHACCYRYLAMMTGSPSQIVRRCDALSSHISSGLSGHAVIQICSPPKEVSHMSVHPCMLD